MNSLFSGAIGAVIGALLSIIYVHYNGKIKERRRVAIETVNHIEELYHRLMSLASVELPEISKNNLEILNEEERGAYLYDYIRLACTFSPFAKIKFTYNCNEIDKLLKKLTLSFQIAFAAINSKDHKTYQQVLETEISENYEEIINYFARETSLSRSLKNKANKLINRTENTSALN